METPRYERQHNMTDNVLFFPLPLMSIVILCQDNIPLTHRSDSSCSCSDSSCSCDVSSCNGVSTVKTAAMMNCFVTDRGRFTNTNRHLQRYLVSRLRCRAWSGVHS